MERSTLPAAPYHLQGGNVALAPGIRLRLGFGIRASSFCISRVQDIPTIAIVVLTPAARQPTPPHPTPSHVTTRHTNPPVVHHHSSLSSCITNAVAAGDAGDAPLLQCSPLSSCPSSALPRDALSRRGPQRRLQRQLGRRLEEVAKAVGGGYCRLQTPLKLALGVRETVAGRRLGALKGGGGGKPPPLLMHRWGHTPAPMFAPLLMPLLCRPPPPPCPTAPLPHCRAGSRANSLEGSPPAPKEGYPQELPPPEGFPPLQEVPKLSALGPGRSATSGVARDPRKVWPRLCSVPGGGGGVGLREGLGQEGRVVGGGGGGLQSPWMGGVCS